MPIKEVLIVARTRMGSGRVCIGALSGTGEDLRLMNQQCRSDVAGESPYKIGEWWKINCEPCGEQKPPHVEDVAVAKCSRIKTEKDVVGYLLSHTSPWKGTVQSLFDAKIRFTNNGGGYISPDDVPTHATGFWISDRDLELESDQRGKTGYYYDGFRHLSYVGAQDEVPKIKRGQLVRVSLARWWKPENADPDFEERCYAQLSGWY
jgi:hypothetical protein